MSLTVVAAPPRDGAAASDFESISPPTNFPLDLFDVIHYSLIDEAEHLSLSDRATPVNRLVPSHQGLRRWIIYKYIDEHK